MIFHGPGATAALYSKRFMSPDFPSEEKEVLRHTLRLRHSSQDADQSRALEENILYFELGCLRYCRWSCGRHERRIFNSYQFVLDKRPASGRAPRPVVTTLVTSRVRQRRSRSSRVFLCTKMR